MNTKYIKADYERKYGRKFEFLSYIKSLFFDFSLQALLYIRILQCIKFKNFKLIKLFIKKRLFKKFHIEIGANCRIGPGLLMPHPHDIVIGGYVEIGKNVSIYNGVTLGAKIENEYDYIKSESERFPIINEGVVIYTGAKVVGHVEIGSNSIIGANSVVTKSFSSYSIIAGVPARMVGCVKKYFE